MTASGSRILVRPASSRIWQRRIDALVNIGLVALLIASTLNGLSFEWGVLGTELTIRPDQVVLVCLLPVLALACLLGRLRLHFILFEWVVLGFLLSNVAASMLFSPARNASLKGTVLLGGYVSMYFVVRQILANRGEWLSSALNWMCGLGIAQAAYCLLAVGLYAFGFVIGGLQIGHLTEGSVAIKGTFWEANLLGAYLGLIALFLTVRYVFSVTRAGSRTDLLGVFITSLALPLTVTRAAGAAFVLGMLAIAVVVWVYRDEIGEWRTRVGKIAVTLGCTVVLTVTAMDALVSTLSGYPNLLRERWMPISWIPIGEEATVVGVTGPPARPPGINRTVELEGAVTHASRSSVDGRIDAWVRAIEASRDRPILGHGTLAGANLIKEGWWYSSLIQALYDTGLVGLVVMLWIHVAAIAYPLRTWLRTRQGPMSANLLGFGIANTVLLLTSQFSNPLFVGFPWVFLGLSMGAVEACSKGHVAGHDPTLAPVGAV